MTSKLKDKVLNVKSAGNTKSFRQVRLSNGQFGTLKQNKNWRVQADSKDFAECKSKLIQIKSIKTVS